MSETDLEYDLRQYKQMLQAIQRYQGRPENLERLKYLISDLEALRYVLRNPPELWLKQFEKKWAVLDEVYAVALDRGGTSLDEAGQRLIDESVVELKSLVQAQIEENK